MVGLARANEGWVVRGLGGVRWRGTGTGAVAARVLWVTLLGDRGVPLRCYGLSLVFAAVQALPGNDASRESPAQFPRRVTPSTGGRVTTTLASPRHVDPHQRMRIRRRRRSAVAKTEPAVMPLVATTAVP